MKTVLVTGGCGFIGSHLVKIIDREDRYNQIVVVDALTYAGKLGNLPKSDKIHFYQNDVADFDGMRRIFRNHRFSDIIHVAAETHVDNSIHHPSKFVHSNVMGTSVLLELTNEAWKNGPVQSRFLYVSTDEVYGSTPAGSSSWVLDKLEPTTPYAASKASAEHMVLSFHKTFGLNAVVTRSPNNYGTHQHPEKLLPKLVRCSKEGRKFTVYGDGNHVRTWIHVEDHCYALLYFVDHGSPGRIFNIPGTKSLSTIQFLNHFNSALKALGRPKVEYELVPDRLGNDRQYFIQGSIALETHHPFEPSLKEVVEWYLNECS